MSQPIVYLFLDTHVSLSVYLVVEELVVPFLFIFLVVVYYRNELLQLAVAQCTY